MINVESIKLSADWLRQKVSEPEDFERLKRFALGAEGAMDRLSKPACRDLTH
jgi:hypothetical protein